MSFTYKLRNGLVLTLIIAISNALAIEIAIDERVKFVFPVLAPPTNSRARVSETAKEYPILLLLANDGKGKNEVARRNVETQPIYVERIEERINPR